MIKTILLNWKTSASGVGAIVTSLLTLIFAIKGGTDSQTVWGVCIMGIFGGMAALAAGDAAASAKSHAESQAQIAELQLRSNLTPNSIDSGDTSLLRNVPMTPAAVPPPPIPVVPPTTNTK